MATGIHRPRMGAEVTSERRPGSVGRLPRVLFFDYWAIPGAVEKFARVRDVDPGAADYRLFHVGSFRDPSVPKAQVVHDIPCTDVSLFRRARVEDVLRIFAPDVVVGLNMTGLLDRTMYMTCERLGIPTVFLQHGSWLDQDSLRAVARQMDRSLRSPREYLVRVPALSWIVPNYLRNRRLTDIRPWKVVARLAVEPATSHHFPSAPEELWPTLALVFMALDAEKLRQTHRIPAERLSVVGNPELDVVATRRDSPLTPEARAATLRSVGLDPARPALCYIEDGFVEQQEYCGWDEQRRVGSVVELCDLASSVGVQVLIRPHPVSRLEPMCTAIDGRRDVVINRDLALLDQVDATCVTIGTMSTALETSIILGRPVVVPLWHINHDPSSSRYVVGGAAHAAKSPGELCEILRSIVGGSPPSLDPRQFVSDRIGPVDGSSRRRAFDAILGLARAHVANGRDFASRRSEG